jgi:peroxiredoxin
MKILLLLIAGEELTKSVLAFLLIAILLLTGLSNSCSIVQYSENASKVLRATVRIIAGDSLGSGVVVGKAGLVLTSNHVMAGGKRAEVFFINGTRYPGRLLLTDADKDLALIQLEGGGTQFPCAGLGSSVESDGLQTGDNLEIIGYPAFTGSDAPTVTSGRISGFPRIESVQFIQTCAPVYPGNSGGPVINRFGEVIGIVNGKYTNAADRCATFATAISEADSMIAEANGRGRGHDLINGPVITQTICPNVGCLAPDFTFSSNEGKQYSVQSLKGKKSILIFTGGDYPLLSRSLECLTKVYGLWPRGQLEIIMVVKQKKDGDAADWVKANGIKFPVLPDANGEITRLYGAEAFPAFYFLNAYGEIKIKRAAAVDLCYEEIDMLLRLY